METERPTFADADPVLNEPQRRRFEVFLELLEESLNEVERIASLPDPVDSVSRIGYDADIPIDFRDRTAPIIQRLRYEQTRLVRGCGKCDWRREQAASRYLHSAENGTGLSNGNVDNQHHRILSARIHPSVCHGRPVGYT